MLSLKNISNHTYICIHTNVENNNIWHIRTKIVLFYKFSWLGPLKSRWHINKMEGKKKIWLFCVCRIIIKTHNKGKSFSKLEIKENFLNQRILFLSDHLSVKSYFWLDSDLEEEEDKDGLYLLAICCWHFSLASFSNVFCSLLTFHSAPCS